MKTEDERFRLNQRTSLDLLTEISEIVLEEQDLQHAFDKILMILNNCFQSVVGQIYVPDRRKKQLWTIGSAVNSSKFQKKQIPAKLLRLNIGEGVAGRVFKSGRLLIFLDIDNDPHFQEEMRQTYRLSSFKTALGIPLLRKNKCQGALTVFFQKKIDFTYEQKCFFSTLGKHLAVSMHIGEIFRKLNYQKTRLEKMAHRDSQTGLPNHRSLQTMLKKSLAEAYRYNNDLTVLMVDIDNFKEINDSHGHLFGDRILKNIAEIFQKNTRSADTVGRFGGDEFLFILPETGIEKGQQLAERLLRSVEKSGVKNDGEEVRTTISIGLSSIDPTKEKISPSKLINQADQALYRAKKRGRNCRIVYGD